MDQQRTGDEDMESSNALAASIAAALTVMTARPVEAPLTRKYVIVGESGRRSVDEREFYSVMPSCARVEVRREPRSDVVTYVCYKA